VLACFQASAAPRLENSGSGSNKPIQHFPTPFSHSSCYISFCCLDFPGIKLDTAQLTYFLTMQEYMELKHRNFLLFLFYHFFHKLFYSCHFYSDMPKCKPTLYVFIDSERNFTHSFYDYKFLVANKMLCTILSRNPLTSSKLFASAGSGLGDNFSLSPLKNDFFLIFIS
jgi:hypothetical protein